MPAVLCMHSDKLCIGAVFNNFGCSPYFSTLFFEQYMDVIYKKTIKRQIMIQKTATGALSAGTAGMLYCCQQKEEMPHMKLTFLGTGAGEGYPGLWCKCPHCDYARKHGGKNIRANSCAVIDEDMLLDVGPACFDNAARFGVDLTHVTRLLITHPHDDHLYPQHLMWRGTNEAQIPLPYVEQMHCGGPRFTEIPELTVYGSACTEEQLSPVLERAEELKLHFHRITEGNAIQDGPYVILPIRGNHVKPGFTHSYIVEKEGKTLLYALDTGIYEDDMMTLLASKHFDLVVMEGTTGLNTQYGGHMCLATNAQMRQYLLKHGCIEENTPFVLTHMSPHWCPPHDWYASIAAQEGLILAYDGMQIEV